MINHRNYNFAICFERQGHFKYFNYNMFVEEIILCNLFDMAG